MTEIKTEIAIAIRAAGEMAAVVAVMAVVAERASGFEAGREARGGLWRVMGATSGREKKREEGKEKGKIEGGWR